MNKFIAILIWITTLVAALFPAWGITYFYNNQTEAIFTMAAIFIWAIYALLIMSAGVLFGFYKWDQKNENTTS